MAELFKLPEDIPLIGTVYFGIIDRGTNVLQIRPTTYCPLNCIFCSTDAGPKSKRRRAEYIIDLDHMLDWIRYLVKIKGGGVEAHIDTVGDPLTYPRIVDLVHKLKDLKEVATVSMQTHGHLLNEKLIKDLDDAGLSRINLSIDALNPQLAKRLAGSEDYDVNRVIEMAKYITENTSIDLLLAPVWVHPLNDSEMENIINLAKQIGAGKNCPPLGIQKCERHKFGRKSKEIKFMTWFEFYNKLRELEFKTNTRLIIKASDFGIRPATSLKTPYSKWERVNVTVVGPGWFKGETLAVTHDKRWAVTIVGAELPIGEEVSVRFLRVKDNILVAKLST
ncbi:MAG: radical SAM protein [Candidatus Methanomethyliales bacterium]|nr:radical SAM protein [Candidatus Methanomethylicales archaeon]